ncbi:SRPBCC family protein [Bacteroidia bacterium]|nr:SRPBCC family protein [Bacteroidia bacterium]
MQYLKYFGIFLLFLVAGFFGMIWMAPSEVSFQVNEDINAPITEVFDATTNPQKLSKWIAGVNTVKQVKGDGSAKGSAYDLFFEGEGNMIMRQTVNVFEPNKLYAYKGIVEDFMEVVSSTEYEALDSNSTRIFTKVSIRPLSQKMKMFMHAKETHKKNSAANFTRLKKYLEK